MKKTIRWLIVAVLALTVLFVGALVVIPMVYDVERFRPQIEKKVSQATGRPVQIGKIGLSLFPWARISLENLQLGNPEGFQRQEFVSVEAFDLRVKLLPLLSQDVEVKRFVIVKPRIVLIKNAQGIENWKFSAIPSGVPPTITEGQPTEPPPADTESKPTTAGLPIRSIDIQEFSISEGSLEYIDETADIRKTVEAFSLSLTDFSLTQPIGLALSAVVEGQAIGLKGKIGPIGTKPGSVPVIFDLTATAAEQLNLQLQGRLDQLLSDPTYRVALNLSEFSARTLLKAMGHPLPVEPADPQALNRISLKADLNGDTRQATVSNGILRIDDTTVAFSAEAASFENPDATFRLDVDRIDLDRYLPASSKPKTGKAESDAPARSDAPPPATPAEKKKSEGTSKPEPATPVDWAPLRRPNIEGKIVLKEMRVRGIETRNIDVQMNGSKGLYRIQPLSMELSEGKVNLDAAFDVRKDTPQSSCKLDMQGVQSGPVVAALTGRDLIEGVMEAKLDLRTAGIDATWIRKTLKGSGLLVFRDGAVKGIDLEGMVRNTGQTVVSWIKGTDQRTRFVEFRVPFRAGEGTIHTDETVLSSPVLRFDTSGDVHLVTEGLDMRIVPKWVHKDRKNTSDILVPLLVQGTFAEPQFRLDLQSAAKQEIRKQIQEKAIDSGELDRVIEKNENLKPLKESAKGLLKSLFD